MLSKASPTDEAVKTAISNEFSTSNAFDLPCSSCIDPSEKTTARQLTARTSNMSNSSTSSSTLSENRTYKRMCPDEESTWLSDEQHKKGRRAQRTLIIISVVTFAFVVAELVGGYLAHSLAIMTDAFHMLSDLFSFIVSIVALQMSRRRPTTRYPYGFHRAEVLGALFSVLMIWGLTALLVYMAVQRIIDDNLDVDARTMIITAAAGVAFNLVIGLLLFICESSNSSGGHNHAHFGVGHTHFHHDNINYVPDEENQATYFTSPPTLKQNGKSLVASAGAPKCDNVTANLSGRHVNLNIRAAFMHAVGDLVQSVGVLLAAVLIHFTGFRLADPICTFFFSILVILTTIPVLRDVYDVLMEAMPSHVHPAKLYSDLMLIDGVSGVHDLRIWSLKSDSLAASLHLELSEDNAQDSRHVVERTRKFLRDKYLFAFITIQTQCSKTSVNAD